MENYRKSLSLCPLCGTSVSSMASVCPGCGHNLRATDCCPMCGAMFEPNADYCKTCGATLIHVAADTELEQTNVNPQNPEQPNCLPEEKAQVTIDDLLRSTEFRNLIDEIKEQPSVKRDDPEEPVAHYEQSGYRGGFRRSFTASRISGDGNAVFPDELIIDDEYVIFRKGRLVGHKEIKIRHRAVGSVHLEKHLLFADIIIETTGGQIIKARGFSRFDADRIVGLIG